YTKPTHHYRTPPSTNNPRGRATTGGGNEISSRLGPFRAPTPRPAQHEQDTHSRTPAPTPHLDNDASETHPIPAALGHTAHTNTGVGPHANRLITCTRTAPTPTTRRTPLETLPPPSNGTPVGLARYIYCVFPHSHQRKIRVIPGGVS